MDGEMKKAVAPALHWSVVGVQPDTTRRDFGPAAPCGCRYAPAQVAWRAVPTTALPISR